MKEIKQKAFAALNLFLDQKISEAEFAIATAKESRNNDTKSSAGDKFETGRAMMQMEIDKAEMQLNHAMQQKYDLNKIDPEKQSVQIEFGSLVKTTNGYYFISVPAGKIEVDGIKLFAISIVSPVGEAMQHKKAGENFRFRDVDFSIIEIQ